MSVYDEMLVDTVEAAPGRAATSAPGAYRGVAPGSWPSNACATTAWPWCPPS